MKAKKCDYMQRAMSWQEREVGCPLDHCCCGTHMKEAAMFPISKSVWEDLVCGWGIKPIPRILSKSMCCRVCGCSGGRTILYTMERLPDGSPKSYAREVEVVRASAWCKSHLGWYLS